MLDIDIVIPAQSLNLVYMLLLYAPACLICYWKLIPRLSPAAQRLLSGMLLAQGLAIGVAILLPTASLWYWLWDLNREFNISSTLASTQLALVAFLALASAWLLRSRAGGQRLYLCALGLIFLFMAVDEYYALHEGFRHWKRYYVAVGAALALATLILALRSPRQARAWHGCFLVGLALAGGGAVFYEFLTVADVELGILRLEGSLDFSLWEEITELLGVWLALLAVAGHFCEALPRPKAHFARLLYALPLVWLAPLYANAQLPGLELRFLAQPAAVKFELDVQLRGYRIDSKRHRRHPSAAVHRFQAGPLQRAWLYAQPGGRGQRRNGRQPKDAGGGAQSPLDAAARRIAAIPSVADARGPRGGAGEGRVLDRTVALA